MNISPNYFQNLVERTSEDSKIVVMAAESIRNVFVETCPWFKFDEIQNVEAVFRFISREVITESSWQRHCEDERRSFTDSRRRNLLLLGACGSGKTTLAIFAASRINGADYYTADEVDMAFSTMPIQEFREEYAPLMADSHGNTVILDDLGSESNRRRYGDASFTSGLIERFCAQWCTAGSTCIVTTNLTLQGIKDRYGDRVISRIREMFDIAAFGVNGTDYRRRAHS